MFLSHSIANKTATQQPNFSTKTPQEFPSNSPAPKGLWLVISPAFSMRFYMKKALFKKLAVVQAAALLASGAAMAALPTEATDAISTAKTDLLAALGAVIAAMVAVWGLRKLGQKMGWL
jgi:Inovirus Coat protein B